jgi:hypothetical protein
MSSAKTSQPCRHVELVRSQVAEVAMCPDCKVVHITLQHVTVRLTSDAFQELVWCVGKAQAIIDNQQEAGRQQGLQTEPPSQEASTLDRVLANFNVSTADKFH